ncbi:MAG: hypothetical protein QOF48_364 [Verrucomicrobiota bacterium]
MRALSISSVLVLLAAGCSRHKEERIAFDAFLATNRIDRIVMIGEDERGTKVIAGEQIRPLLVRLSSSNRVAHRIWSKSIVTSIMFYQGDQHVGGLGYFAREQVLSYCGYEFRLRDTNDISFLFR